MSLLLGFWRHLGRPVALAVAVACVHGVAAAAPLEGLSLHWSGASGAQATLFFAAGGTGVARDDTTGLDAELSWTEPDNGQLCLVFASENACGTVSGPERGGELKGADGAVLGSLSAPQAFGSVILNLLDATGAKGPGDFVVTDSNGAFVGRDVAQAGALPVLPGTYVIEPALDPLAFVDVEVDAGSTPEAGEYAVTNGLWLRLQHYKSDGTCCEERRVLALLRPLEARQAIVGARRQPATDSPATRAEPRSTATPEQVAHALELARAWIDNGGAALVRQGGDYIWLHELMSEAILVNFGDAGDVERLIGFQRAATEWGAPYAAAALEARLGTWRDGALARLANSSDPARVAAMAALANEGDRRWDQSLHDAITAAAWPDASMALTAIKGAANDLRLDAARGFVKRQAADEAAAKAEPDETKRVYPISRGPERPMLLATDDPADLRLAAETSIWASAYELIELAPLMENPEALIWRSEPGKIDDDTVAIVCAVASALPPDDAAGAYDQMAEYLIAESYEALVKAGDIDAVAADKSRNGFGIFTSGCAANEAITTYIEGDYGGHLDLPAVPETWNEAEIIEFFKKGELRWSYYGQFDHLADATVSEAAAAADPKFDAGQLLVAFHDVLRFGTVQWDLANPYVNREARPYLLRLPSGDRYGGSVGGLLRLELRHEAGQLVLTLTPDHRVAYHDYCSLAATISTNCDVTQWLVDPYAQDPTALIVAVRLAGADGDVPLAEAEAPEGAVAYASADQPAGLPKLTLFVTLRIASYEGGPPAVEREIAFPLYSTPLAWRERGLTQ